MIGLKRGTVALYPHETAWEDEARRTMARLCDILGPAVRDIAHVGSTSIRSIKAKPIIDIAVAVDDFGDMLAHEAALRAAGFYYRPDSQKDLPEQLLFACGSYYDGTGDLQTHFIHAVKTDSREWRDYINFRDYMNAVPGAAKAYEALKVELAERAPVDEGRAKYLAGKHGFIVRALAAAMAWSYTGKTVDIVIDRPLGSAHPAHPDMIYPVNYGYIPGTRGGDGEALDVYLLGVDEPVERYAARVIGVIYRKDDAEDKLAAAPEGMCFTRGEIACAVDFQEQYFDTYIETL